MRILSAVLCCVGLSIQAQTFSLVQIGDIHAGSSCWRTNFQTTIAWILANTNDGVLNIKGLISCGDMYEQNTNVYNPGSFGYSPDRLTYIDLTNGFNQLRTNGLLVVTCGGNHDCDADALTDWCTTFNGLSYTNVLPVSFFSKQVGYIGTKDAGDSRNLIMAFTNGEVKLLFLTYSPNFTNSLNFFPDITPDIAVSNQTSWMTNVATSYPDHNVIVLAHYTLAFSVGASIPPSPNPYFSYDDGTGYSRIGPGPAPLSQGFRNMPNLLFYIGGHTRSLYKGHIPVRANDGHMFDVQGFDTQTDARNGVWVNVFTFKPAMGVVDMFTYDSASGRSLTNQDTALTKSIFGGGTQAYPHRWSVPIAVPRHSALFRFP